MEIVARGEQLQASTVEVHFIKMLIIRRRVTRFTTIGAEIDYFLGLIHPLDILHVPSTLGDAVDEFARLII